MVADSTKFGERSLAPAREVWISIDSLVVDDEHQVSSGQEKNQSEWRGTGHRWCRIKSDKNKSKRNRAGNPDE